MILLGDSHFDVVISPAWSIDAGSLGLVDDYHANFLLLLDVEVVTPPSSAIHVVLDVGPLQDHGVYLLIYRCDELSHHLLLH